MLDLSSFDLTLDALRPARVVTVTRVDGSVVRLAEAQRPVTVGATTWTPMENVQISAIKHVLGGSEASMQIDAMMADGGAFERDDVVLGRFENADVQAFKINRANPTTAHLIFTGKIKPVTYNAPYQRVSFDVRGQVAEVQRTFMHKYSVMCRTYLGSPNLCKVPLRPDDIERSTAYALGVFVRVNTTGGSTPDRYADRNYECTTAGTTAGTQPAYTTTIAATQTDGTAVFTCRDAWTRAARVLSIEDRHNVILDRLPDARAVDNWYNEGVIRFWDGNHANISLEVAVWTASSRTVTSYLRIGDVCATTDWVEIAPGCDLTRQMCLDRYNNIHNIRAEPHYQGTSATGQQVFE